MRFFKSVKFRLTYAYLWVTIILLLVFGATSYFLLWYSLYQNLDDSLKTRVEEVGKSLKIEEGDKISFAEGLSGLVLVYDANGVLLHRSGPDIQFVDIDKLVMRTLFGQSISDTVTTGDEQSVRLYTTPYAIEPDKRIAIITGQLTDGVEAVIRTLRWTLGISAASILLLAAISGWFLANRALKPVDKITKTAREIGGSDLSRRINVQGDDELGRLASTLNQMIERLEAVLNRQRQFTTDASHELRTPLAIIQAESTLALDKERTLTEYQKSMELVSQVVVYMSSVIDELLFLARSDTGNETFDFDEINLKELLNELSSDIQVLASEKGLNFNLNPLEDLFVIGDRGKLRQLFLNILVNAVWYTPNGGDISASVVRGKGMATVSVKDTGIGISEEYLSFIFERFYRVDKSRSRAEGGTGLGLPIAKQIAESHGGIIEVESQVGRGSTFHVTLPLSNPDSK